jgi:hypothetical protein
MHGYRPVHAISSFHHRLCSRRQLQGGREPGPASGLQRAAAAITTVAHGPTTLHLLLGTTALNVPDPSAATQARGLTCACVEIVLSDAAVQLLTRQDNAVACLAAQDSIFGLTVGEVGLAAPLPPATGRAYLCTKRRTAWLTRAKKSGAPHTPICLGSWNRLRLEWQAS